LGLAGLALYFIGLFLVGRLWWQLWQQPLTPADRALLGGIGGSFLAYGVSSLTDYQLENIPITGTLLLLMAMLVNLAQAYLSPPARYSPENTAHPQPQSLGMDRRHYICVDAIYPHRSL
jgi:hypothetical protein